VVESNLGAVARVKLSPPRPLELCRSLSRHHKSGIKIDGLALVSAMWCRYCQGKTEAGTDILPNDPRWDRLQAVAKSASKDPTAWLRMADVYGKVGEDDSFVQVFSSALNVIEANGVENAMLQYIQQANKEQATKEDTRDASPTAMR